NAALRAHLVELLAQHLHPMADQPPVGFQLGLARSAQADPALLPLEVTPAMLEAGREMLQLRELDLELALVTARALRKDVQNETGPIDDSALQPQLEVALLRRSEVMVEDDHIRVE